LASIGFTGGLIGRSIGPSSHPEAVLTPVRLRPADQGYPATMKSRVVVLTGASSGIGRAAALAFAARGDRVVLAARGIPDLAGTAAACAGDPLVVPTDVTRARDVDEFAAAAVERFGRIDVWVDTAAVMAYGRFEDVPADVFDRVVTTDLLGPANVARAALRQFRRQGDGTLILSANYAGFVGRPPPPVDSPQRMARAIVRLADKPRTEVSVGATNRLIEFGFGALPAVYDALVGPLMRHGGLSRRAIEPGTGNVFAPQPRVESGPGRWSRVQVGVAAAGVAAAAALLARRLGRS
jgi:NAD(P)-dependent dehydrogenase (short-subunit alcohol dehydrogenase family)